ncbi:MAG: SDR family NAD(P)-dependent oxidoreductase, partial [Actinomycetota bacterium]|nr:SDR family NAD(P)-dependent oxidoreductase [Actinomycetota bacterium]
MAEPPEVTGLDAPASQDSSQVPPICDWHRLLDGRVAVVTGGGAGIGGAVSRLFAEHGALVEVAEVDPDRAAVVVDDIEAAGGTARAHVVDVRSDAEVEDLRSTVLGDHGRIDVLVNNVGDFRPLVRFHESTPESWAEMYAVNLEHLFRVTRAFLESMADGGGGSIVNVHSVEGLRGFPGDPVYAAMKAAVAHFTTSLAVGYGR